MDLYYSAEWVDGDERLPLGTAVWYPTDFHKKERVRETKIKRVCKNRHTYTTKETIFPQLLGTDIFLTREDALFQAKVRRTAKIISLEREIKRDTAALARLASMVIE